MAKNTYFCAAMATLKKYKVPTYIHETRMFTYILCTLSNYLEVTKNGEYYLL